jgi:hypothetical protein
VKGSGKSAVAWIGIAAATHALALSAGLSIGIWFARSSKPGSLIAISYSEERSRLLASQAPSDVAVGALQRHLEVLDELGPTAAPGTELDADRIITFVRLWKVESGLGRAEAASSYLTQARNLCSTAKWRDCSDPGLEGILASYH